MDQGHGRLRLDCAGSMQTCHSGRSRGSFGLMRDPAKWSHASQMIHNIDREDLDIAPAAETGLCLAGCSKEITTMMSRAF